MARRDRTTSAQRQQDRAILLLAVPAFGALVAEPLYVLADTAIVGRISGLALGGLGVAGAVLNAAFGLCNFLAYGTTAAVARHFGAGQDRAAAEHGIAGVWLALIIGAVLGALGVTFTPALVDAMGASAAVTPYAETYLRISLLGAPFVLVAFAVTGYLRGVHDARTPLLIVVAANVVNLVLEIVLVFGLDLGIAGSAWGTVVAQVLGAAAFGFVVARAAGRVGASLRPDAAAIRRCATTGAHLVVRTGSLLVAFLVASSAAARIGDDAIAAHQIAWQLWYLLALALDAIAIAGQSIVGRHLGAGDPAATRDATRRMLRWGIRAGLVAAVVVVVTRPWLPGLFTDDADVRAALAPVLLVVAALQPLGAVVFVLDGVLIGAGDARYLARAMVAATATFLLCAAGALAAGGGLVALWGALGVFLAARAVGLGRRIRSGDWLISGPRLA